MFFYCLYLSEPYVRLFPSDPKEAESIIDRVTPRLSHANAAVVLSSIKVVMKLLALITNQETLKVAEHLTHPFPFLTNQY